MTKIALTLTIVLFLSSSISLLAQGDADKIIVTGPSSASINESVTFNVSFIDTNGNPTGTPSNIEYIKWMITDGNAIGTVESDGDLVGKLRWTQSGYSGVACEIQSYDGSSYHYFYDQVAISITGPTPPNPSVTPIVTKNCNTTTVSYSGLGSPNASLYWQTTSNGTRTDLGYAPSITISTPGPLYIRARSNVAPYPWSDQSQFMGNIEILGSPPPVPATSVDGNTIGDGFTELSVSMVAGATAYKWYQQETGGTAVSYQTTNSYHKLFTQTTSYWVTAITGTCESTSRKKVSAIVFPVPVISVTNGGVVANNEPVTLSVDNFLFDSYAWIDPIGNTISGATSQSYSTNQMGRYKIRVTKGSSEPYITSIGALVTSGLDGLNKNYLISSDFLRPGITSQTNVASLSVNEVSQVFQYFDDLGRPVQSVVLKGSPLKRDVVSPIGYDAVGREPKKYLPYVDVNSHNGWYKDRAILGPSLQDGATPDYHNSDQYNFYNGLAAADIIQDPRPYSETILEASPSARPLKTYGEGQNWSTEQANKFIAYQYLRNTHGTASGQEKVIAWKMDATGALSRETPLASYIETGGYYSTAQLYVKETKDESDHIVREYTNKTGKIVLKKIQSSASPADLNNRDAWAVTYYIYDNLGNLRYILQPELSKIIHQNDTYIPTTSDLKAFAFQYRYDYRNRLTEKLVPGQDWVYLVYNNRDQLILSQDGNQRSGTTKYWTFTKYDGLNRPILTGIKDTTATLTQAAMQTVVNTFYTKSWSKVYENYIGSSAGNVYGYSNRSYPVVNTSATLNTQNFTAVSYYDTYDFKTLWNNDYNYTSDALQQNANNYTYNQPQQELKTVIGQVTAVMAKVLDGGITGGYTWLKTVNYYDDKYHVIQAVADNYKGGIDRTSNLYDFVGKVLTTKTTHSEADILQWKDQIGISLTGNKITRSATGSSWGVSGLASTQYIPAGTDGWIEFTASEDNSSRMIGLSASNADANYTTIGYALYLRNDKTLWIYEANTNKGQISGGYKAGDVFRIQRNGTRIRYFRNGLEITHSLSQQASSTELYADIALGTYLGTIVNVKASFSSGTHKLTKKFVYDHGGRLLEEFHKTDDLAEVSLAKNEYNELGQLVDKKLHSVAGSPHKQSVDYRYNIRGWLTSINDSKLTDGEGDYFGMNLAYNESQDLGATPVYNGNISAIKWSVDMGLSDTTEMAYNFGYDPMNRLSKADNKLRQNNGTWKPGIFHERGLQYDLNGNIQKLARYGEANTRLDSLTYNYGTGASLSNQLLKVTDLGDKWSGFQDGVNTTNDYTYDANGNMITDMNKGISTPITYNYLNLPEVITRSAGTVRYIYDASGRKLAQVTTYGNTSRQTDYVGEFHYEDDALQFISHDEGRIVLAKPELVYSFDGSSAEQVTALNATTSTVKTNGDQTYIVATATTTTRSGLFPIGGTFPAQPGERYRIRVRGYRDKGTAATASAAYIFAQANGADLAWPGAALQSTNSTETWVEQIVTIPNGATELRAGVAWSTALVGNTIYLNDFEITRLSETDPEYQYFIKDHLGNIRVTFTSKDEVDTSLATLEEANKAEEEATFIYADEAVKLYSNLFDHTNNGPSQPTGPTGDPDAPDTSPAGYAALLRGGPNEQYGLAKSLSVMPGDTIAMEVYTKYVDPNSDNWTTQLAQLLASIATGGTAPTGTLIDGGAAGSIGGTTFPFADLLDHTNTDNNTAPKAYLNWLIFDRDYHFKNGGAIQLTEAAAESGQNTDHERLSHQLAIKEPGYVYIYLSNDNETPIDVLFDDFKVEHKKSPVIQTEDYYPFGLSFNSYSQESSVPNMYQYNGKELQDELGIGWLDYGWRNYDPLIGRFNTIDNFADSYFDLNPYQYGANNPIKYIDVNGDSLMLFKNGVYVSTVDNGKKEMTGFNQESTVDEDGNEKFTGGQSFSFNDIDLDRGDIKLGAMTLNFISQANVDKTITDSGILDQDVISRWTYAATESNSDNQRGEGKMDYLSSDPIKSGTLNIINGVGYNYADAGNYLWGYAMGKMGYLSLTSRAAAHMNAWWSAKTSNGPPSTNSNPVMRWFENRSWGGDAAADQRAIQNGLNDSGSYWKAKWKSVKKLWE